MKALLIEFNLRTGVRAGGINPKDPNLICYGWQDLQSEPAIEIRMVEDNRDLSVFNNVPGVTLLTGKSAINQAIQDYIPTRYVIKDKELVIAHLKEKDISLDTFIGKTLSDCAKELYDQGIAGIIKREPKLV